MIRISAQTDAFHAIKFVEAIRRATCMGLKQGLDQVRRLSEGEVLSVSPIEGVTDREFASWLEDCGVVFEVDSSELGG